MDWHSDKLFARSDSFVACVRADADHVGGRASSCSRRSEKLVIVPFGVWLDHGLGLPIGPVPALAAAWPTFTSSSRAAPPETSSASSGPTLGA